MNGIDIRASGSSLIFEALLLNSTGALLATGTTNLYIWELQSNGTLKLFEWEAGANQFTFQTAVTTKFTAMSHQAVDSLDSGLWTKAIATVTGFTVGNVYFFSVNNSGASPAWQMRMFQYGGGQEFSTIAKHPTNYIMGSSVQSNKDDEIDALITGITDIKGTGFVKDVDSMTNLSHGPNIDIEKNWDRVLEPDTVSTIGLTLVANNGIPIASDLTAGVINIYRVRTGALLLIEENKACTKIDGNIYYVYDFPSTSWQGGDKYLALMTGQELTVNGVAYPLSMFSFRGRVTREALIEDLLSGIPTNPLLTDDSRLDNLDAKISEIDVDLAPVINAIAALNNLIALIKAKTDNLPGNTDTMLTIIATYIDEVEELLKNAEYGLSALKDIIQTGGGATPEEIWSHSTRKLTSPLTDEAIPKDMAAPFILPVMQGRVYTAAAEQGKEIRIPRGDTPRGIFQFTGDYTGDYSSWTARFGAKVNRTDTAYIIPLRDCILIYDAPTNTTYGYFDLTETDTTTAYNKLYAEVEIRKDGKIHTPWERRLTIYEDVIK